MWTEIFSISWINELWFFSIQTFKSPSVNLFKTFKPALNSSFWSFKIISMSAAIGAELTAEIKIDLGVSFGFAIIS